MTNREKLREEHSRINLDDDKWWDGNSFVYLVDCLQYIVDKQPEQKSLLTIASALVVLRR